jgi:hypothetical protein
MAKSAPLRFLQGADRATGIIIYDRSGWMSVQIVGAGRPKITRGPGARVYAPDVGATVLRSYYAHYGRYEVNQAKGVVRHIVSGSLYPDETGWSYERHFTIDGDALLLTTEPMTIEGEQRIDRLVWQRI